MDDLLECNILHICFMVMGTFFPQDSLFSHNIPHSSPFIPALISPKVLGMTHCSTSSLICLMIASPSYPSQCRGPGSAETQLVGWGTQLTLVEEGRLSIPWNVLSAGLYSSSSSYTCFWSWHCPTYTRTLACRGRSYQKRSVKSLAFERQGREWRLSGLEVEKVREV